MNDRLVLRDPANGIPGKTRRVTLLLCFAAPAVFMALLYMSIGVWPGSDNSVLVLDLNAQYIYFFEEFREIIRSGDSILYSFKRALGGEFMGIFAYYLSSPFSLIVGLFPKNMILDAMELILVLKCGFTGLTFGYFLTEKLSLRRCLTVMFSVLYALTSFAVVMQHNVMWTDNLIAFPLILLGTDALITRRKFRLFTLSLAYAVASNFYIGYMACLFVFIWFFTRYFMLTPDERNPLGESAHFLKSLARVAVWSAAAVAMTAVILLPTLYSLSFGKFVFSTPDWTPKQLFEFLDILTKAFFGSYDTVRPTGMPFLYCGTAALVLTPLYFLLGSVPRRRKIGFAAVLLFLLVSFNFSPLDIIWHGMQRPNWLNARFAYMFTALILWMTAETLLHIREIGKKAILASAAGWTVILLVCSKIGYSHLHPFRTVWPGLLCFVVCAVFLPPLTERAARKKLRTAPEGPAERPEEIPSGLPEPEDPGQDAEESKNPPAETVPSGESGPAPEEQISPAETGVVLADAVPAGPEEKEQDPPEEHKRADKPRWSLWKIRRAALFLSCILTAEAFANGILMLCALDEDVSFSSRTSYRQMLDTYEPAVEICERDTGFFRSEKLVHRKKNDNFALGIRGLTNSTSTLNAKAVDLLAQFGYAAQSHWSMYAGATAVTDALFGIKYVMADETDNKPVMNYIYDLYELKDTTDTHIDVYENPYCLSIAYAVDARTADFSKPDPNEDSDSYTDPFTYMNRLLSVMTGEETAVWRRAELMGTDPVGCDLIFATGHKGYEKFDSGGASVAFTVQIDSDESLYCYFPSKWPRETSLMLNGNKIGRYFDGEDFSIRELGRFQPGEIINVSLVLKKDDVYIRSGVPYFWYFDEEAFVSAVSKLMNGTMSLTSERDDELYGTVTIPEGRSLLFTTIPYDEGWKVTVDGRPTSVISVLNDTLLAVRINPGEHEISFRYRPACVRNGWILTAAGSAVFLAGCFTEGMIPVYRKKRKRKQDD
jgi:uncharacterized membrane protein YfhO